MPPVYSRQVDMLGAMLMIKQRLLFSAFRFMTRHNPIMYLSVNKDVWRSTGLSVQHGIAAYISLGTV